MKIAVISGSRADRGPLTPVAKALNADWIFVDPISATTKQDAALACAGATAVTAEQLSMKPYDVAVLLGDRYEILGAATAANLLGIPIAHLSGGDITEGSQDDAMRHAITKLSHLHFATNHVSAMRILMMGEEAWRIHIVGCPGIDHMISQDLYSRAETVSLLGLKPNEEFLLVAYQPATLIDNPVAEADELLEALRLLKYKCVFTTVNADAYGRQIQDKFTKFCRSKKGVILEMDSRLYLSAMRHCRLMIGNSSSGFYEAPSMKKPFVNVGNRQKGRLGATSIINCPGAALDIIAAVGRAGMLDCSLTRNPYGDGHAAERIAHTIECLPYNRGLWLNKQFGGDNWLSIKYGSESTHNEHGVSTQKKNLFDGLLESLPIPTRAN